MAREPDTKQHTRACIDEVLLDTMIEALRTPADTSEARLILSIFSHKALEECACPHPSIRTGS